MLIGLFFEQGAVEAFGLPLVRGRTPKTDSQAAHLGGCPIRSRRAASAAATTGPATRPGPSAGTGPAICAPLGSNWHPSVAAAISRAPVC